MQQMQNGTSQAMQNMSSMGAKGGQQAGTGSGGNPYGQQNNNMAGQYNVRREADLGQEQAGPVIASWMSAGPTEVGESVLTYDEAVNEAQQSAERAVTEERVPRRYHGPIKDYFDQLPQQADQIESPPPRRSPGAPR